VWLVGYLYLVPVCISLIALVLGITGVIRVSVHGYKVFGGVNRFQFFLRLVLLRPIHTPLQAPESADLSEDVRLGWCDIVWAFILQFVAILLGLLQ
jgi:hypothetical protein